MRENLYIDLHTHSNYSDGSCSPEEIVRIAKERGLRAVALCDHNTVVGLNEFSAAAKEAEVIFTAVTSLILKWAWDEGIFLYRMSFTKNYKQKKRNNDGGKNVARRCGITLRRRALLQR